MGDWKAKFRKLLLDAMGTTPPITVQPRRRRWSDPVETPSDWWTDEGQKRVNPFCASCRDRYCGECQRHPAVRCALCHELVLPGEPVKRGMCGPCYLRTSEADDAA